MLWNLNIKLIIKVSIWIEVYKERDLYLLLICLSPITSLNIILLHFKLQPCISLSLVIKKNTMAPNLKLHIKLIFLYCQSTIVTSTIYLHDSMPNTCVRMGRAIAIIYHQKLVFGLKILVSIVGFVFYFKFHSLFKYLTIWR